MAMPAQKLRAIPQDPNVMIESKMSAQEADMYAMVRQYRCLKSESSACPARLIIGQAGVVLDCPTCGSVGQTYPLRAERLMAQMAHSRLKSPEIGVAPSPSPSTEGHGGHRLERIRFLGRSRKVKRM